MNKMKPTYEEVVAYCDSEGLIGKVDTVKFYEFYDKQGFMYRGYLMDWKNKLHEWASRQKGAVKQSAKEYNALNKTQKGKKRFMNGTMTDLEYHEWLKRLVDSWGPKEAVA